MSSDKNNREKPEWYVIFENINSRSIEKYNVFRHLGFLDDCDKAWEDNHKNLLDGFDKFQEEVRRSLKYFFWCRCEWEVIIDCFPPDDKFKAKKIDVYDQIIMNWDNFINYLWRYYSEENFSQ